VARAQPAHTVTLGGREIKRIGLGTNRLTDTEANRSFLKQAVDAGLDFIDTAHVYTDGDSEQTIGAALAPFSDELVVATKAGYTGTELPELRSQVERSFERLRTDRITLYYLHRVHPQIPIEESVGVLAEFVDAGRIDHVGLSEVSVEQITRAQAVTPIAAVQNEFNLRERKWDPVIDHCEAEGIVFVPFFPLRADSDAVAEVAERHGATANQVKLAWLLARSPNVAPIPGTLSIDHLKENLGALDLELRDEDLAALG
jgi:aryl-alcohol dehydrogenase-like predicted oxidoreductase